MEVLLGNTDWSGLRLVWEISMYLTQESMRWTLSCWVGWWGGDNRSDLLFILDIKIRPFGRIFCIFKWRREGDSFFSAPPRKTPCDEACHSRHAFPDLFCVGVAAVSNPRFNLPQKKQNTPFGVLFGFFWRRGKVGVRTFLQRKYRASLSGTERTVFKQWWITENLPAYGDSIWNTPLFANFSPYLIQWMAFKDPKHRKQLSSHRWLFRDTA